MENQKNETSNMHSSIQVYEDIEAVRKQKAT